MDVDKMRARALAAGFDASLEDDVGRLLTVLAASKPAGRFLELGTGAGLGTAYLLRGADAASRLTTVELDPELSALARSQVVDDGIEWVVADGGPWLEARCKGGAERFDLVFADTWPGKFTHLAEVLELLAQGGLYVVDDLRPQRNWPEGHQVRVAHLVHELLARPDLVVALVEWASGVIVCTKRYAVPAAGKER